MIPNIHQSVEDLLRSAPPETKLLWQQIRLLTGEQSAVQQFVYHGVIAGSELLTYSANKYYLALEMSFGYAGAAVNGNFFINLFDQSNTQIDGAQLTSVDYESVAAAHFRIGNYFVMKNAAFSRIAQGSYTYLKFIGFKFTM